MAYRSPWQDYLSWWKHGVVRGYNKRNPGSLSKSEDKEERGWYGRGERKSKERWLKHFPFARQGKIAASKDNLEELLREYTEE
mgnify:FL=1